MATRTMKTYDLYWSPTGQKIASGVRASTMKSAKRQAPAPYRKYKGEIYAVQTSENPSWRRTVKRTKKRRRESGMKDWNFPSRQKQLWERDTKRGRGRKNPKISENTMVKLPVSALKKLVRAVKRGERAIVKARKV